MAKSTNTFYFAIDNAVDRILWFRQLKQDAAKHGLAKACETRNVPCYDEAGEYLLSGNTGSYKSVEADMRRIAKDKSLPDRVRAAAKASLAIRAKRMTTSSGSSLEEGDTSKLDAIFGTTTEAA